MSLPHLLDDAASAGESDPKNPDASLGTRSYRACAACRARKVRCIVQGRAAGARCVQCLKDGRRCVFEAKKRSYDISSRTRKAQEKRARLVASETSPTSENLESHEHFNVRSSADALLFLSDAAARHGDDMELPRNPSESAGEHSASYPSNAGLPENRSNSQMQGLIEDLDSQIESPSSPWDNPDIQDRISTFRCRLLAESVIMPHEALAYISFFKNLYPFFPFIPDTYYTCVTSADPDPQAIRLLFEEDEILLGCLITVSSRYYHLPTPAIGGYERSREVHNGCWHWTRRQLSKVLLEGMRPKSLLSAVETLLMLAEWLPKSIHASIENSDVRAHNRDGRSASSSQFVSELILQPAFRTDQVSWSYVGNAFLLLRSLPPSRRICPVLKTSNRYLVTLFSCLIMSQSLARRLGRPSLMSFDDVELIQVSQAFHERNSRLLRSERESRIGANLSLGTSDQFHDAFEVLHPLTRDGIVEPKAENPGPSPRLLTLMQHFDIRNQNWKTRYAGLYETSAPGMSDFSKLMLRADFEYLRLYEFSMSLGAYLKLAQGGNDTATLSGRSFMVPQVNDWEFPPTSLAYYIEQAIDAAEALLRLMLNFHSPTVKNTLRYASSRYYMKIALRTGIPSIPYQELLTATLKDIIATLECCSIDAAHPAFRYSILLRGLMKDIQQPKSPDTSSLSPLTIGPREYRQPLSLVPNELNNGSGVSQRENTSLSDQT
ncbi:hypothetical protein K469DRAFT_723364 [Zopfia rhizophila CBS 207.26]|uniref:Zn(2)-C6 fungal-type domain-containing protein n=1 Tax=Zopfia rhizophila CBS 207.26 TaxID=1314779 RepID=A0A6A6DCG3_9PEZI|nr:hypothetical protein K469DRAFT_723364 [Zopfia rhizophila CBS 207.26]